MALPSSGSHGFPLRRIAVIAVLALLGLGVWLSVRPKPVTVALVNVERGTVEASVSNTRAGAIKACRRAKMSPAAGGQIVRMLVQKGQRVKAGQELIELWHDDLRVQERLAKEELTTAQMEAFQACTRADLADREADRSKQLREKGFISAEGLDQKLSAARVARTGCESARSRIEQSHSRIDAVLAGRERLVLRAPFAGIVADISGELGEYATPSPPGIATIPAIDLIDDSCIYVSAPIDEVDAAQVRVGQRARITLDAIKGEQFPGRVKRIAPYVVDLEKQARTVEVEAEFEQPPADKNLLVGYSADIEIVHDTRANVLRVPTSTLIEGNRVLVYRDGMLEERTITAGLANWEYTEIVSGLGEGDRIVSSLDRTGVKAGARVTPETGK